MSLRSLRSQIPLTERAIAGASPASKLRLDVPTPEGREKFQSLKRKESRLLKSPAFTEIKDFWERQAIVGHKILALECSREQYSHSFQEKLIANNKD